MELKLCGYKVLIDDEDYEKVCSIKWRIDKKSLRNSGSVYFRSNIKIIKKYSTIQLHRVIMNMRLYDGFIVDHINGNTLDNRKSNLRICSIAENVRNQKISKANTSGYKGVSFNRERNKYVASISVNKKRITIGRFDTAQEAHYAYCKASKKYHGEFGRTE